MYCEHDLTSFEEMLIWYVWHVQIWTFCMYLQFSTWHFINNFYLFLGCRELYFIVVSGLFWVVLMDYIITYYHNLCKLHIMYTDYTNKSSQSTERFHDVRHQLVANFYQMKNIKTISSALVSVEGLEFGTIGNCCALFTNTVCWLNFGGSHQERTLCRISSENEWFHPFTVVSPSSISSISTSKRP